jgi:hypothetical protein
MDCAPFAPSVKNRGVFITPKLHCLGVTKDGHPKHPLYLPATVERLPFGRS